MQLYIEPFSGLAGDMFLAALCGLTGNYGKIESLPESLGLSDGKIVFQEVSKNGIVCQMANVIDLGAERSDDRPDQLEHRPHIHHRHLTDILGIIAEGKISDSAKEIARKIFTLVGEAESRVHNVPLEKIHFHEISGVDSILDIVGCAVLLDELKVEKTYSDPICTGFGTVSTAHGVLPVPAPATAQILQNMPTYKGNEHGERATPTGAAILRYLDPNFDPPPLTSRRIAYGPGKKNFDVANVLRVSVVEQITTGVQRQSMIVVESNLDDTPAEYLGADFQDDLLSKGALDVYLTPVHMKKGRPAIKLSVITTHEKLDAISDYILNNTSTIGVRFFTIGRMELPRRKYQINSMYGPVDVKEVTTHSGNSRRKIEYESLRRISKELGISIQQVQTDLLQHCQAQQAEAQEDS